MEMLPEEPDFPEKAFLSLSLSLSLPPFHAGCQLQRDHCPAHADRAAEVPAGAQCQKELPGGVTTR